MIPTNPVCPVFNYAGSAQYCDLPSAEQLRAGVVPLDSLPAAWWNKMWADVTSSLNQAQEAAGCLISEINNVLAGAGICPTSSCLDQLYQSINKIRQTLATATVPGAVVGSADANKVAVAADGTMTVNCFGNATALTTTAHTVVGAINELKSTYDDRISALSSGVAGKAPTMHASTGIDYGIGNASCYGHVKLSDTFDTDLGCTGVAASQTGLANAYQSLYSMIGDAASLGNTVACPAGTASAGTCNTAARSDHVHPAPSGKCLSSYLRGFPPLTATLLPISENAATGAYYKFCICCSAYCSQNDASGSWTICITPDNILNPSTNRWNYHIAPQPNMFGLSGTDYLQASCRYSVGLIHAHVSTGCYMCCSRLYLAVCNCLAVPITLYDNRLQGSTINCVFDIYPGCCCIIKNTGWVCCTFAAADAYVFLSREVCSIGRIS